ncbi:MAG TPA: hypothetical protein VFK06_17640 [Candidatus Angelobacter sp.]|nr:hypothetical protein [Candidatus Angelobacter sp.]
MTYFAKLGRGAARRIALAAVVMMTLFLLPQGARAAGAGDIISLIRTITTTLQGAIGGTLGQIQSINSTISNLRQQVVWPSSLLNQTKGFIGSVRGQYQGLLSQVQQIPTNSATLSNPVRLESTLRSGGGGLIGQITPQFTQVYGSIPQPSDVQSADRNMADMDDAVAMSSLKTTMISDQTSQTMLGLADTLEQQAATAAPGSAGQLAAQARIANLESQAYFAKLLATELRQQATRLAHENAALKKSADSTRTLRIEMQQLLSRP